MVECFLKIRNYIKTPIGYQVDKLKEFRPRHLIGKRLEGMPKVGVVRESLGMSSTDVFVIRNA